MLFIIAIISFEIKQSRNIMHVTRLSALLKSDVDCLFSVYSVILQDFQPYWKLDSTLYVVLYVIFYSGSFLLQHSFSQQITN